MPARRITVTLAHAARILLKLAYWPLTLLPVNSNKILFLSRQNNVPSRDFELLAAALRQENPRIQLHFVCCRFQTNMAGTARFSLALCRSLYHLATSRVAVLDSYWPAVSAVRLRREITVYQMWHSLGKVKISGLAATGKMGGRDRRIASALRMHRGYDFIIAGAPAWNRCFQNSFGARPEQILNYGLPRSDLLAARAEQAASSRALRGREDQRRTVLYAPTFRKGKTRSCSDFARDLLAALDPQKFRVIVRGHAGSILSDKAEHCTDPDPYDLLPRVDFLVSDYSAIVVEAAILGLPTYYYVPDLRQYSTAPGLNINLAAEMPGCVFTEANRLAAALENPYPHSVLDRYRRKWVLPNLGSATADIAAHILAGGPQCN